MSRCIPLLSGLYFLWMCSAACQRHKPQDEAGCLQDSIHAVQEADTVNAVLAPSRSRTALRFDSLGLVNVASLDSSIAVQLLYATPRNFTGEVLYDDLREAYLHREAAEALAKAQSLLQKSHPGCRLIVYDATRPLSAQQKMWDIVKGTSKRNYVSNPAHGGGLHNYGLAVDLSILGNDGTPLPMGTEVDHLGYEANTDHEAQLVEKGIITVQEHENRLLLRSVMRRAGFRTLHSEWWHFNFRSRDEARRRYPLIE